MQNPTRRNRNIGTAKQGRGQNNKLTIPMPCAVSKSFYEILGTYDKIERKINGHDFIFVVETARKSSRHACSIADIERMIENIPIADYGDLKLIIFRQPKRKEEILSPVWGRLIYSYAFEKEYYPAIIIEAVDYNAKIKWNKSLTPEDQRELSRLKSDGHYFLEGKNAFTALIKVENARNTQLYRTLIHEFGHYVHYLEIVDRAGNDDEDFEEWEKRNDKYHKLSSDEKENYAHRYSDDFIKILKEKNVIPFKRIEDQ